MHIIIPCISCLAEHSVEDTSTGISNLELLLDCLALPDRSREKDEGLCMHSPTDYRIMLSIFVKAILL